MNNVKEIIEDIAHRIGEPTMEVPFHEETIRRTMNRVYRHINSEFRLLERFMLVGSSEFVLGTNKGEWYFALPDDFTSVYLMTDYISKAAIDINYVDPHLFVESTNDTDPLIFTIQHQVSTLQAITMMGDANFIRFNRDPIPTDSSLMMFYHSMGRILVNKEDSVLNSGQLWHLETNTPEWQRMFWDALYHGTCIQLKTDYPYFAVDAALFEQVRRRMREWDSRRQNGLTAPMIGGTSEELWWTTDYR